MHVSSKIKAIAFLCAIPILALGALTTEQIVVDLEGLTVSVNVLNDYTKTLNIVDADIDTKEYVYQITTVTDLIRSFNVQVAGTAVNAPISEADQDKIVDVLNPFANSLTNLFHTLVKKIGDFLLAADKTTVADAAFMLESAGGVAVQILQTTGTILFDQGNIDEPEFDDAFAPLNAYTDSHDRLAKKFRFTRH